MHIRTYTYTYTYTHTHTCGTYTDAHFFFLHFPTPLRTLFLFICLHPLSLPGIEERVQSDSWGYVEGAHDIAHADLALRFDSYECLRVCACMCVCEFVCALSILLQNDWCRFISSLFENRMREGTCEREVALSVCEGVECKGYLERILKSPLKANEMAFEI